jgi:hypothetical protein
MPGMRIAGAALLAALFCGALPAAAQQVLVDRGVRAGQLQCFQSAADPKSWYYVPRTARLVLDEDGKPAFSFLRYVVNRPSKEGESKGITQADGGGIISFAAVYDTPQELRDEAQTELKRIARDPEATLRGPILFKEGRYVMISSVLTEQGEDGTVVLASGNAPVFEGNAIPFSFEVNPQQSKLLLESFKMATPDISLQYEMTFEGLSDAFDAELIAHWEEINKNETLGFGVEGGYGNYAKVGAEIEQGFAELQESNAIELKVRGANPNAEALLEKVHAKLLDLMFNRVLPEQQPAPEQGGNDMADALVGMVKGLQQAGAQAAKDYYTPTVLKFSVKYEKKEIKKTGTTTFHMNSMTPRDVNTTFVMNIGDLYKKHGEDQNRFRTVNLSDPAFKQREVHVGIDGSILPEFDKYVNSVTVTLRKQHENGEQTLQEVVVDRNTFKKETRDFRMIYGWQGDDDRAKWLEYEYRTRWSFKDGGLHETDWTRSDINMIDLYAPYERSTVELVGDAKKLAEAGVRAVAVAVEYPFFDGKRTREVSIPTSEQLDGKQLEITLPTGMKGYDYHVTWIRRGKPPLEASGKDTTGFIFLDDLPDEPAAEAEGDGPAAAGGGPAS